MSDKQYRIVVSVEEVLGRETARVIGYWPEDRRFDNLAAAITFGQRARKRIEALTTRDSVPAHAPAGEAFEVIVGNVGTVYSGAALSDAYEAYNAYVGHSQADYGRAAGEPVTLLRGDQLIEEYTPAAAAGEESGS